METTDKFPKTWSKCPACGSERRVIDGIRQDLIAENKWNPATQAALIRQIAILMDPTRPSISPILPAVDVKIDICSDCGNIYAVEAILTEVKQNLRAGPAGGQFPPGMNNPRLS